jgi:hypothetical protein
MQDSSARLMVREGGVEFTMILTRVPVAGWVAAAPSGEDLPLLDPSVYINLSLLNYSYVGQIYASTSHQMKD